MKVTLEFIIVFLYVEIYLRKKLQMQIISFWFKNKQKKKPVLVRIQLS